MVGHIFRFLGYLKMSFNNCGLTLLLLYHEHELFAMKMSANSRTVSF